MLDIWTLNNVCSCRYLVHCLQSDLNNYMPAFLEDPDEQNPQRPKIGEQRPSLMFLDASHLYLFSALYKTDSIKSSFRVIN